MTRLDEGLVELLHHLERLRIDTGDDLRRVHQRPRRVPWIDPFRAVAEVEVAARDEARPVLEHRADQLLGRPRVGRRLENHRGARAQIPGERLRGALDVGQVRGAVAQRGGDRDDRDIEPGERSRARRRHEPTGLQRRGQDLGGDVLDVRLPRREELGALAVDVVADDMVTNLDGAHRQRQADVPLPDDRDLARRKGCHTFSALVRSRPLPLPVRGGSHAVELSARTIATEHRSAQHRPRFGSENSTRLAGATP